MSLIACDQHCQHQQEGYCTLNRISHLTSDRGAKCGYYESRKNPPPPDDATRLWDPARYPLE